MELVGEFVELLEQFLLLLFEILELLEFDLVFPLLV